MSNTLQKEMWNGRAGESWVRHNSLLEQLLAEPGRECMNLLPLTPAMQILDVGCGCGNQTLELAARLDASSTVIGVDISEPMLGLARELKAANDNALSAEVQFALGDASEPLFDEASFDAIYSRFGVMFFDEPVAAFSALRNSLKPGGKLGFVCWREPKLNPFFNSPMEAALTVFPAPAPSAPGAPGPFGLADDNVIQTTLRLAGFKDVSVAPLNLTLSVGAETSLVDVPARCHNSDDGPVGLLCVFHPSNGTGLCVFVWHALGDYCSRDPNFGRKGWSPPLGRRYCWADWSPHCFATWVRRFIIGLLCGPYRRLLRGV